MKIKVIQGDNLVEDVYIDKNKNGIVTIIINTRERWGTWTTGSSHLADGKNTDDFYIYSPDESETNPSLVQIESKEFDGLIAYTIQEKDQIISTYIPLDLLSDGEIIGEWEHSKSKK